MAISICLPDGRQPFPKTNLWGLRPGLMDPKPSINKKEVILIVSDKVLGPNKNLLYIFSILLVSEGFGVP